MENEPSAEVVWAHPQLSELRFLSPQDLAAFHEDARYESLSGPLARDGVDASVHWFLDRKWAAIDRRFERVQSQQLLRFGVPRRDVHYELCGSSSKLVLSGKTFSVAATPAALKPIQRRRQVWLGGSLIIVAVAWIVIAVTRRHASYFNLTNYVTIGLGVLLSAVVFLTFGVVTRVWRATPPRLLPLRSVERGVLIGGLALLLAIVMVRWVQSPTADEARRALAKGDVRRALQVANALEEVKPRAPSTLDVRDEVDIARALAMEDGPKSLMLLDSVTSRGRVGRERSIVEARGVRSKLVDAALARADFVGAYKIVTDWPNRADAEEAPFASRMEARVWDSQLNACRDLPCRWSASFKAAQAEPNATRNAARDRERASLVAALSFSAQPSEPPIARLRKLRASSELATSLGSVAHDADLERRRNQAIALATSERAKVPLIGATSDVVVELLNPAATSVPSGKSFALSEVTIAWTVDGAGRCNGVYLTGAAKGARSISGGSRGETASQLLAQVFGHAVTIPSPAPGKSGASTLTFNEGVTPIVARYLGSDLMELRIGSARP